MAMMVVLAAVLLTYGVSTGIAMKARESGAVAGGDDVLPLDMAENSVDDMYNKCKDEMKKKVPEYLQNEKNKDETFKAVWERSEKYVLNKFKDGKTKSLEKDQIVAICTYTDKSGVYLDFNNAVRTQGPQYKTTFRYHALHFLLTTAIQAERAFEEKQKNQKLCLTGYRRVDKYFSQDVQNKKIRFGSFTSASMGNYGKKDVFGEKSCFEIVTCMGVDISLYSKFENEGEVLIPPYEVFKVEEIKKRSNRLDLPCEVVYKVKSTKTPFSELDCSLFTK